MIENRISALLGRRRESLAHIARGTGISYAAAHALYHETTKAINLETIAKLCAYFGVQPGDLFVYAPTAVESDHPKGSAA